jgi:hypothetical protein
MKNKIKEFKRGEILEHKPTGSIIIIHYKDRTKWGTWTYHFRVIKGHWEKWSNYFLEDSGFMNDLKRIPKLKQELYK